MDEAADHALEGAPERAVRTATRADLSSIAHTHGLAFENDPVSRWMVGEDRTNADRTGRLYRALASGHLADGLSLVTPRTEAAAVWAAPKRFKVPLHRWLPHIPGVLRALGPSGFGRLLSMAEVEHLHPGEAHYYLAVLGTHPAHRGKGHASAVMTPVLERADAEATGCYLESSKEENLAYYTRHGFEVTGTHDLDRGKGPRMWLMWREPLR